MSTVIISFEIPLDSTGNVLTSQGDTDYLDLFEAFTLIQNTIDQAFVEENDIDSMSRKDSFIILESQNYSSDLHSKYNNCTICTEDFIDNDKVSQLLCNHIFHNSCIQEWSHYKDTCPICRTQIKENNY